MAMGGLLQTSRGHGSRIGRYPFSVGAVLCVVMLASLVGSPTPRIPAFTGEAGGAQPRSDLVANFSENPQLMGSCNPVTVTVTLNGTADDGTPPYNFTWDFADHSNPGYGPNVRHTYVGYGNFDVTLSVVDSVGDHTSVTHEVDAPPPACPPIFNPTSNLGSPAGWLLLGMGGLAGGVMLGVFVRVRGGRARVPTLPTGGGPKFS